MLTLAKQITGYFNLKVNQRLLRFILTKIKFIGGRLLDCVKIFIFVTKWEYLVLKTNFKRNILKLKSN